MQIRRRIACPAVRRTALLALGAITSACGSAEEPVRVADARAAAPRVVSLSPPASELVLRLAAGDLLVGADDVSRQLPALSHLPRADLEGAAAHTPELVLTPALHGEDAERARVLRERGIDVLEFSPHDFEDAFALCRALGARLGRRAEAERFVREQARPLARISAVSTGLRRPRVAAVVSLEPLTVAGGHSFTTDLIEIAGAESVTHGSDAPRIAMTAQELAAAAPELVLVTSAAPLSAREREVARALLRGAAEPVFFAFDAERGWLRDPAEDAQRLRARIEPLSRGGR